MNRWIQILVAGIIGAVIGAGLGFSASEPLYRRWMGNDLHAIASKVYAAHDYAGPVTLATLSQLEANQPEKAKETLAREVAAWYRELRKKPKSASNETLCSTIEDISEKSNALKSELAKNADNSRP